MTFRRTGAQDTELGGQAISEGERVAMMQIREMFSQLLERVPNLRVGEPEFVAGNVVRAVKAMPCSTT